MINSFEKKVFKNNLPWLILRSIVGIIFALANVLLGQLSKEFYDKIILSSLSSSNNIIFKLGGQYLLTVLVFVVFYMFQEILIIYIEEKSAKEYRFKLYNSYINMPYSSIEKIKSGKLITNIIDDVDNIKPFGGTVIFDIFNGLVMLIILMTWMFRVNRILALLIIPAPVLFCVAIMFFSTKIFQINDKLFKHIENTNILLSNIINGFNTIKIFLLENIVIKNFSTSITNVCENQIKKDVENIKLQNIWNLIIVPYQAIFFLIAGVLFIRDGSITIGTILAFSNYISFLIFPLMTVLSSMSNFSNIFASRKRISELINYKEKRNKTNKKINGDILIKNLCFSYKNSEDILKNTNFKIQYRKTTVLLGESGSGKSTVAKILSGLYSPKKGTILYKNINEELRFDEVDSDVAYLEQNPFIFEDTVLNNILLGNENIDKIDLEKACLTSFLDEFVNKLPKKYETFLNEKTPLSGGEKQRIALARALIKDSNLLILDEPTSALDKNIAMKLMENIQKNYPERTKLIITHDEDLLKYSDFIFNIKNGKIIQINMSCNI